MIGRLISRFLSRSGRPQAAHLVLGERGERAATRYLQHEEGYQIVATRFSLPLGRGLSGRKISGELDIVAYDGDTLVFVEVKTRTSGEIAAPERAVGLRKRRQIARAARKYRRLMSVEAEPYRYDVVSIISQDNDYTIELLRSYFDDRVFQRSRYWARA